MTSTRCTSCGSLAEADDAFCGNCGSELAPTPDLRVVPAQPSAPEPATPRQSGSARLGWRLVLRRTLAAAVALAVLAGVGLAPRWLPRVLPQKPAEGIALDDGSGWYEDALGDASLVRGESTYASLREVRRKPEAYQRRLLIIPGRVDAVAVGDGKTVLRLTDGGADAIVTYLGARSDLRAGDQISVAGVASSLGDELLALSIGRGRMGENGGLDDLPARTLAACGGFLVAALFLRIRRGVDRRQRARASATLGVCLALVALVPLAGCDIRIDTVVRDDGSGTVDTQVVTGVDKMTELMDLPNADAFVRSWLDAAKADGNEVDRTTNKLRVQRSFGSIEQYDEGATRGMPGGSWSHIGRVRQPDGEHLFFVGRLDTSRLYPDQPADENGRAAYDELVKQLDETKVTYAVTLPGRPLSGTERRQSWSVPMKQSALLFAESAVTSKGLAGPNPTLLAWWRLADQWIAAAAAGVFAFAVLAFPWRRRSVGTEAADAR